MPFSYIYKGGAVRLPVLFGWFACSSRSASIVVERFEGL